MTKSVKESPTIFISHASLDKELADAFVDLLETGIGISSDFIFCSSIPGLGVPAGDWFVEDIRENLNSSKLVILLLSPFFYESIFCQAELGGAWTLDKNIIPLIRPPLKREEVRATLIGREVLRVNYESDLDIVHDQITEALEINKYRTARWNEKKRLFLELYEDFDRNLPKPTKIPYEEYEQLETRYREQLKEVKIVSKENEKLRTQLQEIEQLKDLEQVSEVKKRYSSEWEHFTILTKAVKEIVGGLPRVVGIALFHDARGGEMYAPDQFSSDLEDAKRAEENGFLKWEGDGFIVNTNDDRVSDAQQKIETLRKYLKEESSSELWDTLNEQHDYDINLSNKRFWKDYLGLITY